jgi:tetratricopeptide (TPR) repeat protein
VAFQRERFLDQAIAYYTCVLSLEPQHTDALDERAICWFNVSKKVCFGFFFFFSFFFFFCVSLQDQAIADLEASVRYAKDEADRLVYQAVIAEMKGGMQESLKCSRAALALNPQHGRAYFELGYVLQELPFEPEMKGAIEAYSQAITNGYHRV